MITGRRERLFPADSGGRQVATGAPIKAGRVPAPLQCRTLLFGDAGGWQYRPTAFPRDDPSLHPRLHLSQRFVRRAALRGLLGIREVFAPLPNRLSGRRERSTEIHPEYTFLPRPAAAKAGVGSDALLSDEAGKLSEVRDAELGLLPFGARTAGPLALAEQIPHTKDGLPKALLKKRPLKFCALGSIAEFRSHSNGRH